MKRIGNRREKRRKEEREKRGGKKKRKKEEKKKRKGKERKDKIKMNGVSETIVNSLTRTKKEHIQINKIK